MTMTQTELNEIVRLHKLWLIGKKAGKKANLCGANLCFANLNSADLSSANLSSADLSFANLSSANLCGANLSFANLSSANLSSANLSSANLCGANLSFANLSSADLSDADLSDADLSFANLSSANLSSANLRSADLRSADLSSGVRVVSVLGVGSQRRMTTFRADTDEVWCGCFKGTLAEFTAKIEETHKSNAQHLQDYRSVVAMFRAYAAKSGKACSQCGRIVEKERECYAVPTCYVCLPPPEPLPTRKAAKAGKEGAM